MKASLLASTLSRAALFEAEHVRDAYHLEPDDGEEFCRDCAGPQALPCVPLAHYDSPPRCARCSAWLFGWLTGFGAAELLASLEAGPFDPQSDQDCYLWELCANNYREGSAEYKRLSRLLEGRSQAAT